MEAMVLPKRQAFSEIWGISTRKRIFTFGDEYGETEMRWLLIASPCYSREYNDTMRALKQSKNNPGPFVVFLTVYKRLIVKVSCF
jgi:hypothetical protein